MNMQRGFSNIAIGVIVGLVILGGAGSYFLWSQNLRIKPLVQNQDLFVCDREPTEQIVLLKQEHIVVKNIREQSSTIVGFYTTRENTDLKETYRNLEQVIAYGWGDFYDFIEGYVPPTPLYGLNQRFNDGDLIKIELDINKEYWTENGALRVEKVEKLPFPTRDELITQAELAYITYESAILECADITKYGLPSFRKGVETTYVNWGQENNTALVSYSGQKEVRDIRGELQIVTIDIVLDSEGRPTAIYADSEFKYLTL